MIPPWLWILIAVFGFVGLIVLALCLIRVRLRIVSDGGFALSVCVLFFRFRLIGGEKKPTETKPCPDPKRLLRREERLARREARRAERKKRRKERKQQRAERKKRKEKPTDAPAPPPKPPLSIGEKIGLITSFIKHCYEQTNGRIGVHIKRLHISVGTDDAAKTAILYGAIAQSVALLLELINSGYTPVKYQDGAVAVAPDYLSEKCEAHVDLSLSVTPMRAILIILGLLDAHKLESARAEKKAQRRVAKKAAKQKQSI